MIIMCKMKLCFYVLNLELALAGELSSSSFITYVG